MCGLETLNIESAIVLRSVLQDLEAGKTPKVKLSLKDGKNFDVSVSSVSEELILDASNNEDFIDFYYLKEVQNIELLS